MWNLCENCTNLHISVFQANIFIDIQHNNCKLQTNLILPLQNSRFGIDKVIKPNFLGLILVKNALIY